MEADKAAQGLGLKLQSLEVRSPEDINTAFESMLKERVGAVVTLPDPLLTGSKSGLRTCREVSPAWYRRLP